MFPMDIEEVRNKISPYVNNDYSILDSHRRIYGLLSDCLHTNKEARDLLMKGYDEKIFLIAKKCNALDEDTLMKYENLLSYRQLIDRSKAGWVVVAWFCILGRSVPLKLIELVEHKLDRKSFDKSTEQPEHEENISLTREDLERHKDEYSEDKLWNKVTKYAKKIGVQLLYESLQLYFVTQNPACPLKVKATIYGALGYLIVPFDFIMDFTPAFGYADDATAVAAALVIAQTYIDDKVRFKAKRKLQDIFGNDVIKELEG